MGARGVAYMVNPTSVDVVLCCGTLLEPHASAPSAILSGRGTLIRFPSFLVRDGNALQFLLFQNLQRLDYIKLPALAKEAPKGYQSKFLPISSAGLDRLPARPSCGTPSSILSRKSCWWTKRADRRVRRTSALPAVVAKASTRIESCFECADIEDSPEATIAQWEEKGIYEALEECFDEIWVYGVQSIYDVTREYRLPSGIQNKLSLHGLHHQRPVQSSREDGGPVRAGHCRRRADGEFLLDLFLSEASWK